MKANNDKWDEVSFAGVEKGQFLQTAQMILSERLSVLDEMLELAHSLKEISLGVAEDSTEYGSNAS